MIEKKLIALGFTKRQSVLYLAGLEVGSSPASVIARKSGVKRVTTYQELETMSTKGICSKIVKNHIIHYTMSDPRDLVASIEKEVSSLKESLPEMLGMMNHDASKPVIKSYEGREQLKSLFNSILEDSIGMPEGEPFLSFVGVKDIDSEFNEWLCTEFQDKREKNKLHTKCIIAKESYGYYKHININLEYRTMDSGVFDMANEIVLYGTDKVALLLYTSHELTGVVITSNSFHKSLKSIFYALWKFL